MAKTKPRIAVVLLLGTGFAILPIVATQWEMKDPRRNGIGTETNISHPVDGLLRPAVSFIRLQGVDFCKWR